MADFRFTPIEHDPFDARIRFTPIDHDPHDADAYGQPDSPQAAFAQRLNEMRNRPREVPHVLNPTWQFKLGRAASEHFNAKPGFDWEAFGSPSGERDDPMRTRQVEEVVPLAMGTIGGGAAFAPRGAFGMAGGRMAQPTPRELYHVVGPEWKQGQELRSLFSRYGDKAYDIYAERWPDAGDLWQYHPHLNFFYETLPEATSHAEAFGGRILKVNPEKVPQLQRDTLETRKGFWVSPENVPADALQIMK